MVKKNLEGSQKAETHLSWTLQLAELGTKAPYLSKSYGITKQLWKIPANPPKETEALVGTTLRRPNVPTSCTALSPSEWDLGMRWDTTL